MQADDVGIGEERPPAVGDSRSICFGTCSSIPGPPPADIHAESVRVRGHRPPNPAVSANLAPILMGLILGDDLEQNFRRTLLANDGDYLAFLGGPLNIALAIGVVVVLFLPQIVERIRGKTFRDEFADTTAEV